MRLFTIIPMLLVISILVFAGLDATPGDPLNRMLSPEQAAQMDPQAKEAFREAMGLNGPFYLRYYKWIRGVLKGDFGRSLVSGMEVSQILKNRIPATMELALLALFISSILGIIFGVIAAIKQNTWVDYASAIAGIVGVSIPEFFIAIVAIQIFAIKLKWFPTGGRSVYGATSYIERIPNYIMPALVLGFALTAALMRYTRGSMLDVLNKDYVKTARSKGLPEWKVFIKHAFRNALMPVVLLLSFRLPLLIGGAVIIEQVFIWPGMGRAILEAISGKDYPVVLMATLLTATVVLLASFIVDLFTALLDPRVRIEK
jgi:peptide/nickel transport system permease protein